MHLNKLKNIPDLSKISLFTVFGFANAYCYGLSHCMSKKDYLKKFAYKKNGKLSDLILSNFGSNTFMNAVWTVPTLVLCGQYM